MEDELDAILRQTDIEKLLPSDANFDLLKNDDCTSGSRAFEPPPSVELHPTSASTASSARFKTLVSDIDLEVAKKSAVPYNTNKNTSWAVNIWKQWSANRLQVCTSYSDWPTLLLIAQPPELNYWLSKFVLETKKANGEFYPPDTLYIICSGLQRYIHETWP